MPVTENALNNEPLTEITESKPEVAPARRPSFLDNFKDVVDKSAKVQPEIREVYDSICGGWAIYQATATNKETGREFPVVIDKFTTTEKEFKAEFGTWQKLSKLPYVIEFCDVHEEDGWVYTVVMNYQALGYMSFIEYLAWQQLLGPNRKPYAEIEPTLRRFVTKVLNIFLLFSRTHVTHSVDASMFLIHPLTCKLVISNVGQ